ncbi:MAG: SCO family protein [Micavibrio aeruginosavorus]|uniref:SCO family protein n=1 Tax=Micavibrio aeruginosavorus TaxID=349221 RepID=A0A2W5BI77_9BACT|nr:MAG: SCO family protein [Micavibrio aeruginosavorus]
MTKTQKILLAALVLAAIGAIAGAMLIPSPTANKPQGGLHAVTDDAFGGPFTLTDQNGKTVTEKDLTGSYRLMYFGFTYCPAICPTELSKISAALKQMGSKGDQVVPVFVTVDPERDTVQAMKNYTALFHPSLIGLTGTPEQIKDMLKAYKIYAAKVQDPQMSDYTMDHSSFIYLLAPDDRLLHIFKMDDNAKTMADTTSAWIEQEAR